MTLDAQDLNPGTWFEINFKGKVLNIKKIFLRSLTYGELKRVNRATQKTTFEYKSGQRYENVTVDDELRDQMIFDYAIIDFDISLASSKEKIQCTKENKHALLNDAPEFQRIVLEKIRELTELESAQGENALKN